MNTKIGILLTLLFLASAPQISAHEHHEIVKSKDSSINHSTSLKHDSIIMHEMEAHNVMKAVDAFPNYHPLIVHFPIVLIIFATLFQIFSFFVFKKEFVVVVLILLSLGVVTAWLSSHTFHAHPSTLVGNAKAIFDTHEQMADLAFWLSIFALLAKIIVIFLYKGKFWLEIIVLIFLSGAAITVSVAGHHGAMLVHMEGIGPKGNFLENHENHHDE